MRKIRKMRRPWDRVASYEKMAATMCRNDSRHEHRYVSISDPKAQTLWNDRRDARDWYRASKLNMIRGSNVARRRKQ